MKKKTLYEFLGIEPEATPEEIKAAALHLAQKFHPSKYPGNPKVIARFKKIKQVYRILAHPQKRADYDAALAKKQAEQNLSLEPLSSATSSPAKKNNLWPGEKILYRADIHWFGYIKASLLMLFSIYFLWVDQMGLKTLVIKINFWQNEWLVINILLFIILLLSLFLLIQTLLVQFNTTLMITSYRVISRFGFLYQRHLEIHHNQLEQLEIQQSLLGQWFNFGTLKLVGTQGHDNEKINIKINQIMAPYQFEQKLKPFMSKN